MKPVPPPPSLKTAVDVALAAEDVVEQLRLLFANVKASYKAKRDEESEEFVSKESNGKEQSDEVCDVDANVSQNQERLSGNRVSSRPTMNVARVRKLTSTLRPKSLSDMFVETVSPYVSPIDYYSSQQLIIRCRSVSSSEEEEEEEEEDGGRVRENFRCRQWKSFSNLCQSQQLNRRSDYELRNHHSQSSDMVFSLRRLTKRASTEILPDYAVKRRSYSELKDENEPRDEEVEKSPIRPGLGNPPIQPELESQTSVQELPSVQELSTKFELENRPNAQQLPTECEPENQSNVEELPNDVEQSHPSTVQQLPNDLEQASVPELGNQPVDPKQPSHSQLANEPIDQQLPKEPSDTEHEEPPTVENLSSDAELLNPPSVDELPNPRNNSELKSRLAEIDLAYRPIVEEIICTVLQSLMDQVEEAIKQRQLQGNVNQIMQILAEEAMQADVQHMLLQIIDGKQNQIVKRKHYGIIPVLITSIRNVIPFIERKVREEDSDKVSQDVQHIVHVIVYVVVGTIRKQAEQELIKNSVDDTEQSSDSDEEPLAQLVDNVQINKASVITRKCLRHYDPAYDGTILDKMQTTSFQSLHQYFKDELTQRIRSVVCQKLGFNPPLSLDQFDRIDWNHVTKYTDDDLVSGTLITLDEMKAVKRHWQIPYCHPGPMFDKGSRTNGWYYVDQILQKLQLKDKKGFHYIVRWVGYEDAFNTIESKASLEQTAALDLFELKEKGYATASRAGASIVRRSERVGQLQRNATFHKEMNQLDRLLQTEIDAGRYMSTVGFIHPGTAVDAMTLQFKFYEEEFLPYLESLDTPGFAMGMKALGSIFSNIGHAEELKALRGKCTLKPKYITWLIARGLEVAEKTAPTKDSYTHVSFIVMNQYDSRQTATDKQMVMHMCVYTVRKEGRSVRNSVFFDPAPQCLSRPMPRYLERIKEPKINTPIKRYGTATQEDDCFYQCLNYIVELHSGKIPFGGAQFLAQVHSGKIKGQTVY